MAIDFDNHGATSERSDARETHEGELASGMNITPLVDVLLVLIVMLIITIPVHFHSVSMELPNLGPASDNLPPPVVRIEIDATNQVLWDGEPLPDRATLEARLRAVAQLPDQPEIHIHGAAHSKYDTMAAVLTSSQRLGLQKIGVVGLDEYADPPPAGQTKP